MSDGAVTTICSTVVTVSVTVVTFLTLWVKLKYNSKKAEEAAVAAKKASTAATVATEKAEQHAEKMQQAIMNNSTQNSGLTEQVKEATEAVVAHKGQCGTEIERLARVAEDHHARITALEAQMTAVKMSVDNLSKNVDSTRHEMRGHMQTIVNKLDLAAMKFPTGTVTGVGITPDTK